MNSSDTRSNQLLLSARLRNFLSYGPDSSEIELKPLNVFIGPNGSGKSNFIEALSMLNAAPDDIAMPIRKGGGTREWIWKGGEQETASIEFCVSYPEGPTPLRYQLEFESNRDRFAIVQEAIENSQKLSSEDDGVQSYYRFDRGFPKISYRSEDTQDSSGRRRRGLDEGEFELDQSILKKKKDVHQYPEITYLGEKFGGISIYRDWDTGRDSVLRVAARPDQPNHFLLPDAKNLNLILNSFEASQTREEVDQLLARYIESYMGYKIILGGGGVQLFLKERDIEDLVSAYRLSDGTLRFLCLLAVLCHPKPPPLVCIEEPEICQHPDMLPIIADLLVEASRRTQIVVTTHSDVLVDCLSETPESVVVCEKTSRGTTLRRLDTPEIKEWLKDYGGLGELWRRGHLGGNRW